MTRQIIAFNGKAGSGKSYCSGNLVDEQGFVKYSFADTLRKVAYATIGMEPLNSTEYDKFKKEIVCNGQTFRNILENLGESINRINNLFWTNSCISKIDKDYLGKQDIRVCIDDLRHASEYFALKNYCTKNKIEFKFIYCNYHSDRFQEVNNHPSAQLAQFLEDSGFKHLQEVDEHTMLVYKTTIEDLRK